MQPATERDLDVLIVGAGFGGMYMLHAARSRGLSARVLESAAGVGGTWFHNRYPGARVDIESLEYSYSFSDELQQHWHWTERYAAQPEILGYANHVADRFGLRADIELDARVSSAHFDETARRWRVRTGDGREWSARFFVAATGQLSTPVTPHWPGLDGFTGALYYTGAWPHEPVSFEGQRVGVVGTGSSGVQVIPMIARQARELLVFQRTPCYAVPARNAPLDPHYEATVKGEYASFRARGRLLPGGYGVRLPPSQASALAVSPEDCEAEFERRWQDGGFSFIGAFGDLLLNHESNALASEFVRRKIRSTVRDPRTAELLCPAFPIACRRLCVGSEYYETYNRDNVRLVDLNSEPIARLTATAIVTHSKTDERAHPIDALVLATGFDAMTGTLTRIDLRGRAGISIADKWCEGPSNYLGLTMAGFPNFFHITGPGSTLAFTNAIVAIEHHVDWIADCIQYLDANGHETIEASPAAEAEWMEYVRKSAERTVLLSCNSLYLGSNVPGKPRVFMPLVAGFPRYARKCSEVAASGYEGFVIG
jgi:cyclohexanone monooxygenase